MPYVAEDILVTVRGAIGPSEAWFNTWAFVPDGPSPDAQAVVDQLNIFYSALASDWFPTEFTAVGAQIRYLLAGQTEEATWISIAGVQPDDMLPSQLAVRVSLTASGGVHGGPFLAGWNKASSAEDGLFDSSPQTEVATQLADLQTAAQAADYAIGIHRPTVPSVVLATIGRVGERFDIIRKRGNDTPEAYVVVPL